jgi:hypothetical protein
MPKPKREGGKMTLRSRVSRIEGHLPENRHLAIEDMLRWSHLHRKQELTKEEEAFLGDLQSRPVEQRLAEILKRLRAGR